MTNHNHNNVYRFRVSAQDLPQSDLALQMFVQHDQPPTYFDFLNKIKQYIQISFLNVQSYDIFIVKDDSYKYILKNDTSLENAFKSISSQDKLTIKLIKKRCNKVDNNRMIKSPITTTVPLIKPIFIRQPSQLIDTGAEAEYNAKRKDSGISLDQDINQFEKQTLTASNKLPAITHNNNITNPPYNSSLTTTEPQYNNNYYLPSPPQTNYYGSKPPINLPGLSSIITDLYDQNIDKKLAPINTYRPSLCEVMYDLSPPVISVTPTLPSKIKSNHKETRKSSISYQSQFICEHVVDKIAGTKCCQSFRRSYDLSRHQAIHLKNRPLCYCLDCGKKFTRLDALRRHERIQGHNNNKIKNF